MRAVAGRVGLLLLWVLLPGCQSTQPMIDHRLPLREPEASDPAAIPVTARDCRERWLGIGSPELEPDLGIALERARTALPQTTALRDLYVRRETTVTGLVDRCCLVVEARAVRAEDAEPLDDATETGGVSGFMTRLIEGAGSALR